jgi:hypothetical protein
VSSTNCVDVVACLNGFAGSVLGSWSVGLIGLIPVG